MKRFLTVLLFCLISAKSQALDFFKTSQPSEGSLCDPNASSFPILFSFSPTNNVAIPPSGTYTATLMDSFGVAVSASSLVMDVNGNFTALFNLTTLGALSTPGTVSFQTPIGNYSYPFYIRPCGLAVLLQGPSEIVVAPHSPNRFFWYYAVKTDRTLLFDAPRTLLFLSECS